jgi:uncharacterized DUF497 family protein
MLLAIYSARDVWRLQESSDFSQGRTSIGGMIAWINKGSSMDIGFVWDEEKYRQVLAEYQVRFYEVVSAFEDQNGYEVPDPAGHTERWMWVGKTAHGRLLVVIYSEEELLLYRVVTAVDAEGSWLDVYNQGHDR